MNLDTENLPPPPVITKPGRVRRFFAELGPGLITGAADDDPSGISTYSVTGAAFGAVLRKLFQSTKSSKPLFVRQQSETAKRQTSPDPAHHFLLLF